MKRICICGGGSLGHVIAGWLSANHKAEVFILSGRPEKWTCNIDVFTPSEEILHGTVTKTSADPAEVIPDIPFSQVDNDVDLEDEDDFIIDLEALTIPSDPYP